MVVDRHGKGDLGLVLADDILVQHSLYLLGGGQLVRDILREGGVLVLKLLPQDPHAKLHALIADPDAGALDHAVDLLLVLAAEGAAQGFLCVVTHAITSKSG